MSIVVVGLNHKTAPLSVREKVSFPDTEEPLRALKGLDGIEEGTILSTCNRVELCVATPHTKDAAKNLQGFLSTYHGYHSEKLSSYLYKLNDLEAVHHMFRVTSSLDSMVVGESQIFGQVKQAYDRAKEAKTVGPVLHRFYHKAFSTAKRVRRETRVGSESVSVGSIAIDLSEKIFNHLENKVILLIGTGDMIEVAALRLLEKGVSQFYITNRTPEHMVKLTHSLKKGGDAHFRCLPLSDFQAYLDTVDMIFVSTSSPSYLLTKPMMETAMKRRKNRPLFCMDISVPRNVDPSIHDIDNIYLYDIDDLEIIIKENTKKRKKEAERAEAIVKEEATHFYRWLNALEFAPTLTSIRQKIEDMRKKELEGLFSSLPHLTSQERKHIERFSKRFSNKALHDPLLSIKEEAKNNNVRFVEFLRRLFRLS